MAVGRENRIFRARPGRTWHHRRTLRPAVTSDLRPRAPELSGGVLVAGKRGSCPAGGGMGVSVKWLNGRLL